MSQRRLPAQFKIQSTSCVLDLVNRAGFVPESQVLAIGTNRQLYAIGYRPKDRRRGPYDFASINAVRHVPTLSRLPLEAGIDLIQLDRVVREALGFDTADDLVSNSNLAANFGGAAAGTTIKGHLHLVTVGAYAQKYHSAMGLMLLRRMYDRSRGFAKNMVADLDALLRSGATAEEYDTHINYWKEQLRLLELEKRGSDAYRRKR